MQAVWVAIGSLAPIILYILLMIICDFRHSLSAFFGTCDGAVGDECPAS